MTSPDYALTIFMQHLCEVNWDGDYMSPTERNRCKRWMDAVLSPIDSRGDVYKSRRDSSPRVEKGCWITQSRPSSRLEGRHFYTWR